MGQHHKHSKNARGASNKKVASYVTAGVALEVVTLFGLSYATDIPLLGVSPLAATTIFIDGTKDILPTNDSQDPDRMRHALGGALDQTDGVGPSGNNVYIDYSRAFGILTGPGSPGYEDSKAEARQKTIQAIKDAQDDPTYNSGDGIYVVGFSQGSNAASDVIEQLESEGYDTSDVTFVLLGNGARNDGGLWARLPAGVYVPLIGLRFGASTNPTPTTDPNAPTIIQISKQYDGASDVPKYVMNPLAWANAVAGFLYVHNGYYEDVDFDFNDDGKIDNYDVNIAENDIDGDLDVDSDDAALKAAGKTSNYMVTRNGNVTDIVIKNPVGQLPITQPLLALGVPQEVVTAMDPILRAMIETAYDRPTDGVYAATPVHLQLMPGPNQWKTDTLSFVAAWKQTEENLDALHDAQVAQQQAQPLSIQQGQDQNQLRIANIEEKPQTPAVEQETTPQARKFPSWTHGQESGFAPWHPPAPAYAPPAPAYTPAPPAPPAPVAAEAEGEGEDLQKTVGSDGEEIIIEGTGAGTTTKAPAGGPNKFAPPGVKAIRSAINGVVSSVTGILKPKTTTTTGGGATATTPDPDPAPAPAAADPEPSNDDAGGGSTP